MELQDDQGILRKKQKKVMSLKTFKIIKLCLITALPAAYFIYSMALLPLCILYAIMFFIAGSIERNANRNLKKEYCISISKIDSVFAFIAVAITAAGLILSFASTSMKGGMFEGKTDEEIKAEMEEKGLDSAEIEKMLKRMNGRDIGTGRLMMSVKNGLTLLSGERVFFTSYGGFQRGRVPKMEKPEGIEMPEGMEPPNDMGGSGMMDMARNIPFEMIFSQIASSVNTVIIFLIPLSGLYTLYLMKKNNF